MSAGLIIVTGASKGIGRQISKRIVERGVKVLGIGRDSTELTSLSNELGDDNFHFIAGDIAREDTVNRIFEFVSKNEFSLKGLVNNAGTITPISKIANLDINEVKSAFGTNLFSIIHLTTTLLPLILKYQGTIINVSSGASTNPYTGWSSYCCTKAALNMFTMCLAKEHSGILTLSIRPGVVDTGMQTLIRGGGKESMGQDFEKFITLKDSGKLLEPDVPAKVIARLAVEGFDSSLSGKFLSWDDSSLG
ncbi:hypothetical protein DSO57_1031235 [Entomophthora muscae]|uniref:Uncharacterized protein n=1 Tax=Entomophthora muscae TaxID=34485 RepID=A0ACC2SDC4_9FUNG|nr:hypothetical protein DSO57_1031235 [Entomophthora muscae]